jgi:hypothetical protein
MSERAVAESRQLSNGAIAAIFCQSESATYIACGREHKGGSTAAGPAGEAGGEKDTLRSPDM